MTALLYPPRCPLCGEISDGFCTKCRQKAKYVTGPRCFKCGKPVLSEEAEYCSDCIRIGHSFTAGRSLLVYEDMVKKSIYSIKYGNKREYLEYYAEDICKFLGENLCKWAPEVIIPIPMYRKKQRARGFNQAEVLAGYLGKQLEIQVCSDVLIKVRETPDQKELDRASRRSNLKNAFYVAMPDLPWKKVLLVDDVYTTGSTMDAAASVLMEHGAEKIFFVTICTGQGE